MGKGVRGGFGVKRPNAGNGNNMQALLRQAQQMQASMEKDKEEIAAKEVEGTSGGGAVTVVVSGKKEIKSIELKPEVVDPDDIEMLQDLIMVAVNEAMRQMEEISQKEMGSLTAGLGIPGL